MAPTTTIAAVPTATSTVTRPLNAACRRATSTPRTIRCSLGPVTRSRSMSSAPKALMTGIAESASVARDAISPSLWRCSRDLARTRMR